MTRVVSALPRITGTVTVDVSGHVGADGWLSPEGEHALWYGLAGVRGLPVRVRIEIGALTGTTGRVRCVLEEAAGCTAVEVCGTEPEGVARFVAMVREALT